MRATLAFYFFGILLSTMTTTMAQLKPASSSPSSLNNNSSGLAASVAKFSSKLLQETGGKTTGNIIFSPVSLHALLSQLVLGAPKKSSTYTELVSALHLNSAAADDDDKLLEGFLKQKETPGVKIANRLYADQSTDVKQEFIDGLVKYFKSTIVQEDFSNPKLAAQHINEFISNQTNGLITKMLDSNSISSNTKLILLNVIYFKGLWKHRFTASFTREAPFFVDTNRTTTHMSMVIQRDFKTAHFNQLQSELLLLPYKDEKTAMVIILPDDGVDVRRVEEKLVDVELGQIWEVLNSSYEDIVTVNLPKFEASHELGNLENVLRNLGLVNLFDESLADLSRISNEERLVVSKVAHKAVIKVDEEGSEAAAASDAGVATLSAPPSFTVDRPFIFFIYDIDNGLPLFVGRIVDPNGEISLLD